MTAHLDFDKEIVYTEIMSMGKLSEEATVFTVQLKEELEALNIFHYCKVILPYTRSDVRARSKLLCLGSDFNTKRVQPVTDLLTVHPEQRRAICFPSHRFTALHKAAVVVNQSYSRDLQENEIVPVFTQLKQHIIEFADKHNVEPTDDNISKLLALGYVRSTGAGLIVPRRAVNYDTSSDDPLDTVWSEMIKYVEKGFFLHNIIRLLSIAYASSEYSATRFGVKRPVVTAELAEEFGLNEIPVEWQKEFLAAHFKQEIVLV